MRPAFEKNSNASLNLMSAGKFFTKTAFSSSSGPPLAAFPSMDEVSLWSSSDESFSTITEMCEVLIFMLAYRSEFQTFVQLTVASLVRVVAPALSADDFQRTVELILVAMAQKHMLKYEFLGLLVFLSMGIGCRQQRTTRSLWDRSSLNDHWSCHAGYWFDHIGDIGLECYRAYCAVDD